MEAPAGGAQPPGFTIETTADHATVGTGKGAVIQPRTKHRLAGIMLQLGILVTVGSTDCSDESSSPLELKAWNQNTDPKAQRTRPDNID